MATVEEINKTFAEKGISIELPLPGNWLVKEIEVLEKKKLPSSRIGVLLGVKFYDDRGREISELFFCEGHVEAERERRVEAAEVQGPLKSVFLPPREKATFEDEEDAKTYLREAISHLLQDKGYRQVKQSGADLYFEKGAQGFFINLSPRCDEKGLEKARALIEMRRKHGSQHEYGLVVPAFQESLGIPLYEQEKWVLRNQDYMSAHRIGVYAVDNEDPNRIYAFTIYPPTRDLVRYFIATTPQWPFVRARYVKAARQEAG